MIFLRRLILVSFLWILYFDGTCQPEFEKNTTLTWEETISVYKKMAKKYKYASIMEYGISDGGKPIHLFVISPTGEFNPEVLKKKNHRIILINNGIHPGEPDGIEACILLAENLLQKHNLPKVLSQTVLCIIPIYNVDGAVNRNNTSRVNQNGPEEYGFRGTALNLDLNRDFIKADSRNTHAFIRIFREWDPDLFIDTHVTNGADYQHTLTLITSQAQKLQTELSAWFHGVMVPEMYNRVEKRGYPMCPYVNTVADIPDSGLVAFLETPRYSTGYAALFNTPAFIVETHMLKPFPQRVKATYVFLEEAIDLVVKKGSELVLARNKAKAAMMEQSSFPLRWTVDKQSENEFLFHGYEAEYIPSAVTGKPRLKYNIDKPYKKAIPYFETYLIQDKVSAPVAYVIPQAWTGVIERLKMNGVNTMTLARDTVFNGLFYYIDKYKSVSNPFEGHYMHYDVEVRNAEMQRAFSAGDHVVFTDQDTRRFLIETLEPKGGDSYFAWNFFDSVLQQKEWFSGYLFEDTADSLLKNDSAIKNKFEEKLLNDPGFKNDSQAQLLFIYKQSDFYEKNHNLYPVGRLMYKLPKEILSGRDRK